MISETDRACSPRFVGEVSLDAVGGREKSTAQDVMLLGRVARRDTLAFEQVYDRFSRPMFSMVLRIVRSRPEAEDVLQDAFFAIWNRAPNYRPDRGSPFSWIATIMRHKAIDRLRSQIRRDKRLVEDIPACTEDEAAPGGLAPLIATETERAVRSALATLGPGEHRAIELSFFDGLTHPEIAAQLGIPAGTVKARIRRGMLKLRTKLAGVSFTL